MDLLSTFPPIPIVRHPDESFHFMEEIINQTIREWLSRIDKDSQAARAKRIFQHAYATHSFGAPCADSLGQATLSSAEFIMAR